MHESTLESVGGVLAELLPKGEFGSDSPAWDILRDEEVLVATNLLLAQMDARVAVTLDRCYLIPTDASSPLLRGAPRMADVFRDQGKDEPGRANLEALLTLLVLRKLLDWRSEDGLSQAGRGGVVPVETMVNECEDAIGQLARQEGLSDFMRAGIAEWDRSARPGTGHRNVFAHEGFVRYVLSALAGKGLITIDNGDADRMAHFGPTERLATQAREVLNSERYHQLVAAMHPEE